MATPEFKILFTSNRFDAKSHIDKFVVKKVNRLRNEDSINLFIAKIPLSEDEKNEFLDYSKIQELH